MIGDIPFSGKIVPAAAIVNLSVGEHIGNEVACQYGSERGTILSVLTVVN